MAGGYDDGQVKADHKRLAEAHENRIYVVLGVAPDETTEPRWVIIHFDRPIPENVQAHAFGPFESAAAADAFAHAAPGDECYAVAVVVVGPDDRDVDATRDLS